MTSVFQNTLEQRDDPKKGDDLSMEFEESKMVKRQVSLDEAREFCEKEELLFLGETSCFDDFGNSAEIFKKLVLAVHETQIDLVKRGEKYLEDIKFGEEERNIRYDRCCY